MPEQRASLGLDLAFTGDEFQKLIAGRVPEYMEDKWFLFFEDPWLYLHRSWTGICVYQVRLELQDGVHRVTEATVNRDSTQYGEDDDHQDVLLLSKLLFGQVGRDSSHLWAQYKAGIGWAVR